MGMPGLRQSHSAPSIAPLRELYDNEALLRAAFRRHTGSTGSGSTLFGCLQRKQLPEVFQEVGLDDRTVQRLHRFLEAHFKGKWHSDDAVSIHEFMDIYNKYIARVEAVRDSTTGLEQDKLDTSAFSSNISDLPQRGTRTTSFTRSGAKRESHFRGTYLLNQSSRGL